MRVLLLTLCYLPDAAPNAPIMTALAEGLAALGHELIVVTAFPHYGQSRPYAGYSGWRLVQECRDGIRIVRTPLYVGKEGSTAGKILSWLSFNLIGTWMAARVGPADVIIAPSPPLTLGLSEWLLSSLWRVPHIYNPQDIYPDVSVEQGYLRNRYAIMMLRSLEKMVYTKAAAVTVLSEAHKANLLDKGVPSDKVVVIPNFVDTDFIRPLPRQNPWSATQGLDDRFVVAYAGNIGASQRLEVLLEVASVLRAREDIVFLVIGRGTGKVSLEERSQRMGLSNVRFLPFQPWERLPEVYASADVHLVMLRRGITGSMPSKAYGIMAAGRPLLASVEENSEVARLVQRSGGGRLVPPEDPQAMVEAILDMAGDAKMRRGMGESGRTHIVEHYSKQAVACQYDRLIRRIVSEARRADLHVRDCG